MDAALQEAKSWIDNHLAHKTAILQSGAADEVSKSHVS
jgi:hypothetical protein